MQTIAIVGASLAGLRGAEALRRRGFDGRLVWIGAEPHPPYDRPPLSKEILRGEAPPESTALAGEEGLAGLEADLRLGRRAVRLHAPERKIELDDGSLVAFDGLLVATGARPRLTPGWRALDGLFTLRTLDDALALRAALAAGPRRVVVVGGGFIGAEVAASCRALGLPVTLVEMDSAPFGRALGVDVGRALGGVHADHGVELCLGAGVEAYEGERRIEAVRLLDGRRVEADVVVVGVGVTPETEWLEGSGVRCGDGVLCDDTCATSVPGVVAAGDVARWRNPLYGESMRIEHWSHATEQAAAAAGTLLADPGGGTSFGTVPFFWSDQYDLKIQSAGFLPGFDTARVVRGALGERRFLVLYGRKGRFVGAVAANEPRRLIQCKSALREVTGFEEAVARFRG